MLRKSLAALCTALLLSAASLVNAAASTTALPALHTEGNRIKSSAGADVTLKGVSVIAPEQNDVCTDCNNKPINDLIDMTVSNGWNSKVLRLLVTEAIGKDLNAYDATYIKPYVDHAVAKGLYVIIDLHLVRNYGDAAGAVPQADVKGFWDFIAPRYANNPNVLFEVFNEPIAPDNWATWKSYIQPVVNSIRSVASNVILMGSPSWSTRLNGALTDPVTGGNIAYVYHLYPNQGPATAANLDPKFGTASATLPVVLTEFGWDPSPSANQVTAGTTSGWGLPLRQYLDARPQIGWMGWIFDNFWAPVMFDKSWNLLSGEYQGAFIRDWLAGAPATSPCSSHLARGATVTASSTYDATSGAPKAVDGSCADSGRWMSAVGDTAPVLTVDLGTYKDVSQVDVYSGYGYPNVATGTVLTAFKVEGHTSAGWVQLGSYTANTRALVSTVVTSAAVNQIRLTISDPSSITPDIARVYEVAAH